MPGIIVPRKTVSEVVRLLKDHSDEDHGPVAIDLSAQKIRFAIAGIVLTSKLIDGTFPDYQRVIPQGNDKILTHTGGDTTLVKLADAGSPTTFQSRDGAPALFVLMPMRV